MGVPPCYLPCVFRPLAPPGGAMGFTRSACLCYRPGSIHRRHRRHRAGRRRGLAARRWPPVNWPPKTQPWRSLPRMPVFVAAAEQTLAKSPVRPSWIGCSLSSAATRPRQRFGALLRRSCCCPAAQPAGPAAGGHVYQGTPSSPPRPSTVTTWRPSSPAHPPIFRIGNRENRIRKSPGAV